MLFKKLPSTKGDLLTSIRGSRSFFDKEYWFELVKSISEKTVGWLGFMAYQLL